MKRGIAGEEGTLKNMPDFGEKWTWVRDLAEGGQAHTFLVKRKDGSEDTLYVLKRLKNLNRIERFRREIEACKEARTCERLAHVDWATIRKGDLSGHRVLRRRIARSECASCHDARVGRARDIPTDTQEPEPGCTGMLVTAFCKLDTWSICA